MNSFGRNAYYWRHLQPEERLQILSLRKAQSRPWHSLPHAVDAGQYMLTAACYEHAPIIGRNAVRLVNFENRLLEILDTCCAKIHAWVILPNHYHVLVSTDNITGILKEMGRMHGRISYVWNGEDTQRSRKVWCGTGETRMKNDRHFWASMNYIHHNPVKHGYVKQWTEWPYSSATQFLDAVGRKQATEMWNEYDITGMGIEWDP